MMSVTSAPSASSTMFRQLSGRSSRVISSAKSTFILQRQRWSLSSLPLSSTSVVEYNRSYTSRAHPKPIPQFPIGQALNMILDGVQQRKEQRAERWSRSMTKKNVAPSSSPEPYRNLDETIEMAINLNVDPRRPGQAIRGSLVLPHGTGKKQVKCLVFTNDEALAQQAATGGGDGGGGTGTGTGTGSVSTSSDGSITAGGDGLIEQILSGDVSVDEYERALCTKDILPQLQKQLARLLGPRGLMPNVKTNTVFDNTTTAGGDDEKQLLLRTLREQSQTVTYRTDSNGILHFVVGKGSFEPKQLFDNMQAICQTVQDVKPESYGKGKKKGSGGSGGKGGKKGGMGKNVKYWLKAHLTSTQGKGSVRMDLRTVDPTSPFFMKEPE